jgi:hypothetical protein
MQAAIRRLQLRSSPDAPVFKDFDSLQMRGSGSPPCICVSLPDSAIALAGGVSPASTNMPPCIRDFGPRRRL